jgi:ribosomal protein L37AE/L43A
MNLSMPQKKNAAKKVAVLFCPKDKMTDEPQIPEHDDLDTDGDSYAETYADMVAEHERERKALARCPNCGSINIRRSHSEGFIDKIMRLTGRRPYRCRDCRDRFHARRGLMDS